MQMKELFFFLGTQLMEVFVLPKSQPSTSKGNTVPGRVLQLSSTFFQMYMQHISLVFFIGFFFTCLRLALVPT